MMFPTWFGGKRYLLENLRHCDIIRWTTILYRGSRPAPPVVGILAKKPQVSLPVRYRGRNQEAGTTQNVLDTAHNSTNPQVTDPDQKARAEGIIGVAAGWLVRTQQAKSTAAYAYVDIQLRYRRAR